ncbi:hypothetical protein BDQ17DRAFT_1430253 [Cyathus striatus]|nr:hypothetical protein BDQ17DRAFT_1430253 [Cyathus striatus]
MDEEPHKKATRLQDPGEGDLAVIDPKTTETTEKIERVINDYSSMNGINLFKLIINPKDFGHSVENLFAFHPHT